MRLPMSSMTSIACWFQEPAVSMAIGMKMCHRDIIISLFLHISEEQIVALLHTTNAISSGERVTANTIIVRENV